MEDNICIRTKISLETKNKIGVLLKEFKDKSGLTIYESSFFKMALDNFIKDIETNGLILEFKR